MDRTELGQRLRARRVARGMTLREAAPLAGLTYAQLAAIERGANTTLDRLESIAKALDIPLKVATDDPPAIPEQRLPILARFAAILPHLPDDELDVFVHEIALWERHYGPKS